MSASNIFCFIRSGEYGETSIRTVTTHTHYGMFICLAREYFSTRYGQLITACSSFVQCLSTLVPQYSVQTLTSACLLLSTLVPQYSVRTTHHGLFISQYVSTVVLGTDDSSRHVYLLSTLVLQCSVWTTHHGMFIGLVRQYCSTRYGQLITACSSIVQCLSALVPQYSVQALATARLFAQYVSTVVLNTDNSSRLVLHFFSALLRQYLSARYGQLIMACLFPQYVSTVVLGTHNSSRRVLHLFSALVCQYLSTWQRHLITSCSSFLQCLSTLLPQYSEQTLTTAVYLLSTLHRKKYLIPKLGISKEFPKLNPNNGYYMGIWMKFPK